METAEKSGVGENETSSLCEVGSRGEGSACSTTEVSNLGSETGRELVGPLRLHGAQTKSGFLLRAGQSSIWQPLASADAEAIRGGTYPCYKDNWNNCPNPENSACDTNDDCVWEERNGLWDWYCPEGSTGWYQYESGWGEVSEDTVGGDSYITYEDVACVVEKACDEDPCQTEGDPGMPFGFFTWCVEGNTNVGFPSEHRHTPSYATGMYCSPYPP